MSRSGSDAASGGRGLFAAPQLKFARQGGAAEINRALVDRFEQVRQDPGIRRTHLFDGRYENLYPPEDLLPEIRPIIESALGHARRLLGAADLRVGFWLNAMGPGESTSTHSHDDDDELLVGVYYVSAPPGSGDLVITHRGLRFRLTPEAGLFAFFAPDLVHAVEPNASGEMRLSVAFNFGPVHPA